MFVIHIVFFFKNFLIWNDFMIILMFLFCNLIILLYFDNWLWFNSLNCLLTFWWTFFYQRRYLCKSLSFWCSTFVLIHSFFAMQTQMQHWNCAPFQRNSSSSWLNFFFQIIHFLTDFLHGFCHVVHYLRHVDIFIFHNNACFQHFHRLLYVSQETQCFCIFNVLHL